MSCPKGVLFDRRFLPGRIAKDHIEPVTRGAGTPPGTPPGNEGDEGRSALWLRCHAASDLWIWCFSLSQFSGWIADFGIERLGDDDVAQGSRRSHRRARASSMARRAASTSLSDASASFASLVSGCLAWPSRLSASTGNKLVAGCSNQLRISSMVPIPTSAFPSHEIVIEHR